jgi:hypothetical protein
MFKKSFAGIILAFGFLLFLLFVTPLPVSAGHDEEAAAQRLFDAFVSGLKPETMEMIVDGGPDENGRIRRIYLDLEGCELGGVRIESLKIDASDVTFTPPATWDEKGPDVKEMLDVKASAVILEQDVNEALLVKQFGNDDEHWHDLSLDFREGGIYARGYYLAQFIFKFDILLEMEGSFAVRHGQEIWLDDYKVRVNKVDVPDGLTQRAISRIQPVIDLGEFPFPLVLDSIIQEEDKVVIKSRLEPKPFEGRTYTFKRK